MVNRLMRPLQQSAPPYRVYARYNGVIPEGVGMITLQTGDCGWIPWELAKRLEDVFDILEYDQSLVDLAVRMGMTHTIDELPGFICPICWEQGELLVYRKQQQLIGHLGNHNPNHGKRGWPLGKPRKDPADLVSKKPKTKIRGRPKGTTKEVMERRRRAERQKKAKGVG